MIAFLIAGLVLGVLARTLRGGFGAPQVTVTVAAGVAGALAGGVGVNAVLGDEPGALTVWSLLGALVGGVLVLGVVEGGTTRRGVTRRGATD